MQVDKIADNILSMITYEHHCNYVTFILMPTFVNARLFPANRLKAYSVVTGCNLDNRELRVA